MRYLLDTCALIWLGMGGGDLSANAKRRITVASSLHYSSIPSGRLPDCRRTGKSLSLLMQRSFLLT